MAIKLEAVDAEDIRYLVTYLMDGLRQRSTYAVAVESYEGEKPTFRMECLFYNIAFEVFGVLPR